MLTTGELSWIKNMQREFKTKFNKSLSIDFASMKNISFDDDVSFDDLLEIKDLGNVHTSDNLKICLSRLMTKHNVSEADLKEKQSRNPNKKEMLVEFCKRVLNSPWDISEAAKLVGFNRSLVYYYGDITYKRRSGKRREMTLYK